MKRNLSLVILLGTALFFMGFKGRNNSLHTVVNTETYNISTKQINDLKFMYQEEKLARDVYIELNKIWGLRVFNNISNSEQQHMDSVKSILDKYNIKVNYNDKVGEFDSEEFSNLYQELISEGKKSTESALAVGVKIEKLDISDLKARLNGATPDIEFLYNNLINGSENHLKAFSR